MPIQASPNTTLTLNSLLEFNDDEFVHNAYEALLRRPPDPSGLQSNLQQLSNGESKLGILKQLRFSPEGGHDSAIALELDIAIQGMISDTERLLFVSTNVKNIYYKFKAAAEMSSRKVT
ncbi:DUF4214 domain-containing protein [Aquirhabdus parva]|nr:DUF4214 domain-containing protein [Aquirhabdus parva]